MDGTVTAVETLPMIATHFGLLDEVEELTQQAVMGDVPFAHSFTRRVALLGHLPVDEVNRLVAQVPLHRLVAGFVMRHSDQCVIVSSNLDCWCSGLLQRLGCKGHFSKACVDDNRVVGIDEVLSKRAVVDEYRAAGHQVVFVGDGHNDLEAMSHADVAIAVGLTPGTPAPSLTRVAHHIYRDEAALCRRLEALSRVPSDDATICRG